MKIEITTFRVIMASIFTMLILVAIWLYLLFTASPNPTVDYVALYNASNKPTNYDESQNAWPLYEQAIAAAVIIPSEIQNLVSNKELPTPEQEAGIGKILTANQQTLELLRQAVDKPYCYIELQLKAGESMYEDGIPEIGSFRNMAKMLSLSCLYNISEGNIDQAISDISACAKLSRHLRLESAMLIEQLIGLGIDNLWQGSAYLVLENADMTPSQKEMLTKIVSDAIEYPYIMNFEGEKLGFYDFTQGVFVGSNKGNGRFAWKRRWHSLDAIGEKPDYGSLEIWLSELKKFSTCAFGATQKEVLDYYNKCLVLDRKASMMTPWQREHDSSGIMQEIEEIDAKVRSACLAGSYLSGSHIFDISYFRKVNLSGLLTVLAIKEFQLAQNRLPQKLAELVEKQYLKEVPLDPFSDGELVYKVDGDSYMLYSWGYDLKDDGGNRDDDFVFWPLPEPEPQQADDELER